MDVIELVGMAFYGYHGALSEETRLGQRFYVDVTLELDLAPAGETDDLTRGVSYVEVYDLCRQLVEGEPVKLLECLTGRINRAILERFALVQKVTTCVRKPSAPIAGLLDYVAVRRSAQR